MTGRCEVGEGDEPASILLFEGDRACGIPGNGMVEVIGVAMTSQSKQQKESLRRFRY